jgi:V8-like Glu-specific endopeptidase
MKHSAQLLFSAIALFIAFSSTSQAATEQKNKKDKIIGENSMLNVNADLSNIDQSLRPYMNAIGIMVTPGEIDQASGQQSYGVCTGTHIGNGYVVSAGHCFIEEKDHAKEVVLTDKDCSSTFIVWGYRGPSAQSARGVAKSSCTKILYAERSPTRDFVLFKVDMPAPAKISITPAASRPDDGSKITIFGYPNGDPLHWSQYCTISGAAGADFFAHQCDTLGGNSGSSVLAIDSNGTPSIIGIHDSAAMGDLPYNFATYISGVKKVLLSRNINLDSLSL